MEQKSILRFLLIVLLALCLASFIMVSCILFDDSGEKQETQDEPVDISEETTEEDAPEEEKTDEPVEEIRENIPVKIWMEDIIPREIKDVTKACIDGDNDLEYVLRKEDAEVFLEIVPAGVVTDGTGTSGDLDISYVMAPCTSFFNMADGLEWEDFKAWWSGDDEALTYISQNGIAPVMALERKDYTLLTKILGEPVNQNIHIMGKQDITAGLLDGSITFSVTPFDDIGREVKVLEVSGLSVFDRELRIEDYPFAFSVILRGDDKIDVDRTHSLVTDVSFSNRDMSKLTSLMMTGVTAMARYKNIGKKMDEMGILYPAEKIASVLSSADITHISNEIPFVEGCTDENRFPFMCSDPAYMELLRYVGTDVVELTGNHMNDYGGEWFLYTLDMYEDEGWPYFGGGRDLEDCYSPAILESNGNRFAFLGFNWWGPEYAWATEESPGSSPGPGEEYFTKYEEIVKNLKDQGYIVIFTFQYLESERYSPVSQQINDFRRMIDAGADIVSGSQSHYPMGVEFYNDGFINYGLGNLFFNMRNILGLKQGIIAEHIFYNGKHINTLLITTMLENLSQVRLTTPEERIELLGLIFNGSIK